MKIGELAQQAGVSVRALRYYEEQGLLSPERTPSGQRRYTEDTVEVVRLFITAADPAAGRLTATR
jgi:DNA-binding transcriptional MerR regulator